MTIAEAVLELESVGGRVAVWNPTLLSHRKTIYVNSTHRLHPGTGRPDALISIWGDSSGCVEDSSVWVGVLRVVEDRRAAS